MISVVVPAFNEEKNIGTFFERISKVLKNETFEIVFVDDGSSDKTAAKIRALAQKNPTVRGIFLSRNFGHQSALTAGLSFAAGDAVISMDADLQDPPELIPKMLKKWRAGAKIVYARRQNRHEHFFKKYSAIFYYKILGKFSDCSIPRNVGDFRLLDRRVVDELLKMPERARYLRGMVAWLGFSTDFVDFDRPNRQKGETGYSFRKMARLAMDGILNFSFFPLKVGFLIGVFSILAAGIFLAIMLFDVLMNGTPYPLYKWLSVILLAFAGIQFIFLWILGEYIGRIYDDVRHRHLFVISDKINFKNEKNSRHRQ